MPDDTAPTGMQFPEYGTKLSLSAVESRDGLPVELLPIVNKIEDNIARSPDCSDCIQPLPSDSAVRVYVHPDPEIQVTFEIQEKKETVLITHYAAPRYTPKPTIFISYSHVDKEFLDKKIRPYITVLEQKGVIKFWDDSQLISGIPWEEQIDQVLEDAKAGLLLVSQEYLTSKYITKSELMTLLKSAKEKRKLVFWLHISPSTVFHSHEEIAELQSPQPDPDKTLKEYSDADRRKVLVEISRSLDAAIASDGPIGVIG